MERLLLARIYPGPTGRAPKPRTWQRIHLWSSSQAAAALVLRGLLERVVWAAPVRPSAPHAAGSHSSVLLSTVLSPCRTLSSCGLSQLDVHYFRNIMSFNYCLHGSLQSDDRPFIAIMLAIAPRPFTVSLSSAQTAVYCFPSKFHYLCVSSLARSSLLSQYVLLPQQHVH